jgi:hypothetical protein
MGHFLVAAAILARELSSAWIIHKSKIDAGQIYMVFSKEGGAHMTGKTC